MNMNLQVEFEELGAGLLGFVAVVAIGGGVLMVRDSLEAGQGVLVPIDLESAATPLRPGGFAQAPAPSLDARAAAADAAAFDSASPPAADVRPESAANEEWTRPRLETAPSLDRADGDSAAEAVVEIAAAREKEAASEARKVLSRAAPPRTRARAAVHYGVTSREELMGRAAGPVYNFTGGASRRGSGQMGGLADEIDLQIADIRRQLDVADIPDDQRARFQRDLEAASASLDGSAP